MAAANLTHSGELDNCIDFDNAKAFCHKAMGLGPRPPLQCFEVVLGGRLQGPECEYVAGEVKAASMTLILNLSDRPKRIRIPIDSGCDVNEGVRDAGEIRSSLNKENDTVNLRRVESMTLVIYLSDCCCPEHPHVCRYTGKLNTACLVHPREESDGASPVQSVGTRRPECGGFAPEECRVCEVLVSEAHKNSSVTKSTSFHKRVRQHLSRFIKKGARLGMMCLPGLWG